MRYAFLAVIVVVVGVVVWFAFHHSTPTSQADAPSFSKPTVGSRPVAGATETLGDYISGRQYGVAGGIGGGAAGLVGAEYGYGIREA